jgi:hypothetical protein
MSRDGRDPERPPPPPPISRPTVPSNRTGDGLSRQSTKVVFFSIQWRIYHSSGSQLSRWVLSGERTNGHEAPQNLLFCCPENRYMRGTLRPSHGEPQQWHLGTYPLPRWHGKFWWRSLWGARDTTPLLPSITFAGGGATMTKKQALERLGQYWTGGAPGSPGPDTKAPGDDNQHRKRAEVKDWRFR